MHCHVGLERGRGAGLGWGRSALVRSQTAVLSSFLTVLKPWHLETPPVEGHVAILA